MGNIECYKVSCPRPECTHPSNGECCPVCDDCNFEGRLYKNLEFFSNEREQCQQCVCNHGNITCSTVCSNKCSYRGQQYEDGETFSHYSDPCQDCVCNQGSVTCSRGQCPSVRCSHPVQGQCCRECTDCFYGNKEYRNRQRFRDGCKDCYCSGITII